MSNNNMKMDQYNKSVPCEAMIKFTDVVDFKSPYVFRMESR